METNIPTRHEAGVSSTNYQTNCPFLFTLFLYLFMGPQSAEVVPGSKITSMIRIHCRW